MRTESCDLCVVGGGYTGLWTAIIAKERDPSRDVVLIDAGEIGSAASGRNGGFMESSLTHGVANGQERFPDEIELLEQLGLENLDAIETAIHRYDIDCDFERTGVIDVATTAHAPSYLDELRDDATQLRRLGQDARWLDAEAMRAEVDVADLRRRTVAIGRAALVDPARLAWGLKAAAERLGVRIYEDTKATKLERDGVGVLVTTPLGAVRAARVALGTNAFKPLLRQMRHYIAPVYDYCMVTEPLTESQLASIGWRNRQGLSDIPNQFHYYRLTEDNRILWGGYDTVYYWRGRVAAELESRPATWATLSRHFFETFPQLDGIRFSHIWGGAIDTCSRFCVFWGTAMSGRVAYALGYTGLGVASTRFGADVMLDLLDGRRSVATATDFVKKKPLPFPPEPFRFLGIQATRWSLQREDRTGKPQPLAPRPRQPRPRLRQLRSPVRSECVVRDRCAANTRMAPNTRMDSAGGGLEGSAGEHLGEVGAVLDAGVEVGLRVGLGGGLLGGVGDRRPARPAPTPTLVARIGVEPMLTRPTPASPLRRHAATPTIAQSWARRLNFWKPHPAPCIFGTRISVSSSSSAQRRGEEALVEVGGGDLARAVRALGDVGRAERQRRRRQVGRRVGVGDRPADRAPVAHLRVADVAGRVGEQRDVLGEHVGLLDVHVPGERADGDVVAGVADVRQVATAGRCRRARSAGPGAASSAAAGCGRRRGTWRPRRARRSG